MAPNTPKAVYSVIESRMELSHQNAQDDLPIDPKEFLENFRNDFQMRILEQKDHDLVFELINVDASFANALRRILLAEVPTVAIETVYMWENTSIIHDEVLAHRLGLIPIDFDARLLDEYGEDPTDRNTLVFSLSVICQGADSSAHRGNYNPTNDGSNTVIEDSQLESVAYDAAKANTRKVHYPEERPYTMHVYSRDLKWIPQGDQEERIENVKCVHDDILIAKLRPGQKIELEAHARKGIGKDHAKYSPVATASYRLMPLIELLEDIYDEDADELVNVYEPGVFELINTDRSDPPGTRHKAKLTNAYACTMSRNFMRNPRLAKAIRMSRIPDHFIFSVESVGAVKPGVLVAEALRVLQRKCQRVIDLADETKSN